MMAAMTGVEKKIFRFGVYEVDVGSGELRKAGRRLRMQEQPFQALLLLLARPGEVVTREEFRQKLWPADTFVDFDHSLNTAINKIREALDDSAANPRFVETLARRGYRFLAPLEASGDGVAKIERPIAAGAAKVSREGESSSFRLTHPEELPKVGSAYVRAWFVLIQIMYLSFYVLALGRMAAVQDQLDRIFGGHPAATVVLIVSAGVGIPVRLYWLSAAGFDVKGLSQKFLKLFPGLLVLDELWALSPFLLAPKIGIGLALGITAALIYVPFAERSLVLMRARSAAVAE
ncbi:MAG: winged helix-turn-helix domain-containing protein [Candidatus Sulfotelmatobacter sp.]|jgi:DNA-binding winged helix-turn-helix (wHTH) protein